MSDDVNAREVFLVPHPKMSSEWRLQPLLRRLLAMPGKTAEAVTPNSRPPPSYSNAQLTGTALRLESLRYGKSPIARRPPMWHDVSMDREPLDKELARASDRIVNLILHSDLEWIDIEIEADKMRQRVLEEAPEKLPVFERIYPARFQRIWRQWRVFAVGETES